MSTYMCCDGCISGTICRKVNEPVYDIWMDAKEDFAVPISTPEHEFINGDSMVYLKIIADVANEFDEAIGKFPPFNSAHEGFSVLNEEVDELWEHVRGKQGSRSVEEMRKEAVQVAAMAVRFIFDICDNNRGQK